MTTLRAIALGVHAKIGETHPNGEHHETNFKSLCGGRHIRGTGTIRDNRVGPANANSYEYAQGHHTKRWLDAHEHSNKHVKSYPAPRSYGNWWR